MDEKEKEKLFNPENDFIDSKPVGITIDEKEFKIKEFSGTEVDNINNDYITIVQNEADPLHGKLIADMAKRNLAWLGIAVVDAPYQKDGKKFVELTQVEKRELLNNLKPKIRLPLIQAISDLNAVESGVAKNYKKQS